MPPWFQPRPGPFQPGPFRQLPGRPRGNFMFRQNIPPTRPATGGGFLRNLLNRGSRNAAYSHMNPFQMGNPMQMTGQSSLGNSMNLDTISKFLGQTQQVLRTAQQIGPMVQQYGPLIRNLPALWKLYKGMKSADDTKEESLEVQDEGTDEQEKRDGEMEENPELDDNGEQNDGNGNGGKKKRKQKKTGEKQRRMETKPSVPKLYI